MVHIDLNPGEADMLQDILGSYLSDLRLEIADTDRADFRDALKRKEVFLKGLLARLEGPKARI